MHKTNVGGIIIIIICTFPFNIDTFLSSLFHLCIMQRGYLLKALYLFRHTTKNHHHHLSGFLPIDSEMYNCNYAFITEWYFFNFVMEKIILSNAFTRSYLLCNQVMSWHDTRDVIFKLTSPWIIIYLNFKFICWAFIKINSI